MAAVLVRDLLAGGWSRRQLAGALARGGAVRLRPGVVSTSAPPSRADVLHADVLYAGPGAALGGATACAVHGLAVPPRRRRLVLVPAPRTVRDQPGLHARTTTRPFNVVDVGGVRLVDVPRAVTDAALELTDLADVRALVCGAVQRGEVRLDALAEEVDRAPRRGGAQLRRALQDAEAGAWSAPEAEALDLLAPRRRDRRGLHRNCLLLDPDGFAVARPHWHAVGTGAVGQVHSREHHSSGDAFDRTLWTDGGLVDAGYQVFAVTPRQLRQSPAAVAGRWERFLQRQHGLGDPPGTCRLLDGSLVVHPGTSWPPSSAYRSA